MKSSENARHTALRENKEESKKHIITGFFSDTFSFFYVWKLRLPIPLCHKLCLTEQKSRLPLGKTEQRRAPILLLRKNRRQR